MMKRKELFTDPILKKGGPHYSELYPHAHVEIDEGLEDWSEQIERHRQEATEEGDHSSTSGELRPATAGGDTDATTSKE